MYSLHKRFLLPTLLLLLASGCDRKSCENEKCGGATEQDCWSCTFVEGADAGSTLEYSGKEILSRVEGTWTGPGIELTVTGAPGGTLSYEPLARTPGCSIPANADESCIGLGIPVRLTGKMANESFETDAVQALGRALSTSKGLLRGNDSFGLPFANASLVEGNGKAVGTIRVVFAADMVLWVQKDSGELVRSGTRM